MRKLLEQLEEMHIRIAETSSAEETLVKALGEALARLDHQLLQDVQTIAAEHEERRTAILGELQGLATSVGMFQVPRAAPAQLEMEVQPYALAGDWREAMKQIPEEFDDRVHTAPRHSPREPGRVLTNLAERRRRVSGA